MTVNRSILHKWYHFMICDDTNKWFVHNIFKLFFLSFLYHIYNSFVQSNDRSISIDMSHIGRMTANQVDHNIFIFILFICLSISSETCRRHTWLDDWLPSAPFLHSPLIDFDFFHLFRSVFFKCSQVHAVYRSLERFLILVTGFNHWIWTWISKWTPS